MTSVWNQWQQTAQGIGKGKDYSDMSKDALAEEAEYRGLAKSGTKAELIARLEEDDAE